MRCGFCDDGEIKWQILQGEVYGRRMGEAEPFPGVMEFIEAARRRGIEMFIVSHKTRYSNYDTLKVDLRAAALAWMEKNGFFDPARLGFSREQIFFADTRAEKDRVDFRSRLRSVHRRSRRGVRRSDLSGERHARPVYV